MKYSIAIVGERWEAVFAAATARMLSQWCSDEVEVWAPSEFEPALRGAWEPIHFVPPSQPAFENYQQVRDRVVTQADHPVLVLPAGVLLSDSEQRKWGSRSKGRSVEWVSTDMGPPVVHFQEPSHHPPCTPRHRLTRQGRLQVWEIDGGDHYYSALLAQARSPSAPVFDNYGPRRPVFAYNTNEFDEPQVRAHQQYAVLASGLLGLRMVVESNPPAGATVIVYDINPDQLAWCRELLAHAAAIPSFEEVIARFKAHAPNVSVRPVESHELPNALLQADWYSSHRRGLAELNSRLRWQFVLCDLWTDPCPLLELLNPEHSTMFMYLDIFLIWNILTEQPWVEHHVGVANSLEVMLRKRINAPLTFVPGEQSRRFQLTRESPFWEGGSCTYPHSGVIAR